MTSKLLKTLGMVSALAISGVGCSKIPLTIENASYDGVKRNKEDAETYVYFNGQKSGIVNLDRDFDTMGSEYGSRHNIYGYSTASGRYATNIVSATHSE